ncbi:RNA polymerase sigma-70 factor [Bacteroides acidifaciens]|jgi:RNA polymerase sigma-70 factor (ECF subfamily)|uniref:RNA polymerase sigma-70 factor n=6 Tax=Bacteroides TaxID=816 RepID=A0A4S2APP4_9BACE|nr:RNA polymerase sigma-70 factor [Bacteroides acidifaciens]
MAFFMLFIDVVLGKNIIFVYSKILYNMKEEELIEQVKKGNNIAFAALYDYYWQRVYNFTKLYVTSSDSISEIVQDVFVKFWESRHLLDSNRKVEGFLFIITRNIIFNKARSRMREDMFKMTVLRSIENEEPYNQEDRMVAEDLKEYIDRLIAVLPERQREIFLMSREENMTYREIALRCGIGEKAVERHIHLTLKFLKKNLLLFILFSMLPE